MKRFFTIITVVFTIATLSFGQKKAEIFSFGQKTNEILEEGKLLCLLEKASWYGTDLFLEKFLHENDRAGGYLSYLNEDNQVINLFFERNDASRIIVRFVFDGSPVYIDTLNHVATQQEIDLITIRLKTNQEIYKNENDFFSFYKNTGFNLIPIIRNGEKKVYVLTGPKDSDVVILGNDYLLTYNNENELVKKEKLHNSILRYPNKLEGYKIGDTTYHTHILSDLITLTDVCTLLLYKDYVKWKRHCVMGRKYVTLFDLEKESMTVMTTKEYYEMVKRK